MGKMIADLPTFGKPNYGAIGTAFDLNRDASPGRRDDDPKGGRLTREMTTDTILAIGTGLVAKW